MSAYSEGLKWQLVKLWFVPSHNGRSNTLKHTECVLVRRIIMISRNNGTFLQCCLCEPHTTLDNTRPSSNANLSLRNTFHTVLCQYLSCLDETGVAVIGVDFGGSPGTCPSIIHSFIHSGHFYSASSSPLLLRNAPNTAQILCRSFTLKRHRQL